MKKFLDIADELEEIGRVKQSVKSGESVLISGCSGSAKAHIAESIRKDKGINLIVVNDESSVHEYATNCSFFGAEILEFPAKDILFYSVDMHSDEVIRKRLACIDKIIRWKNEKKKKPLTVVTTIDALTDPLINIDRYKKAQIIIKKGEEKDISEITQQLVSIGYERVDCVSQEGEFCIRGGILDVYPIAYENPVRVEFWGDEADSIRTFDSETQRSLEENDTVEIFPATDTFFTEEEVECGMKAIKKDTEKRLDELGDNEKKKSKEVYDSCNRLRSLYAELERTRDYGKFIGYFEKKPLSFLDYFSDDNVLVIFDEPAGITSKYETVLREYKDSTESRYQNGYCLLKQTKYIKKLSEIYKKANEKGMVIMSVFGTEPKEYRIKTQIEVKSNSSLSYNNSFSTLISDLKKYKSLKYRICITTSSTAREKRLIKDIGEEDLTAISAGRGSKEVLPGQIIISVGALSGGFEYKDIRYVCISENDIFKVKKAKKAKKRTHIDITSLDIVPGDYVVHEEHGIGIYQGIETIKHDGIEKDYAKIEYNSGGLLFVLATQVDMLQKYASGDTEKKPKTDVLGSVAWKNTKKKAKAAAEIIATDLVELYAERSKQSGFVYSKDTQWQQEFEEQFPFDETYDQLEAVKDIKRDMESGKIMDRLVCGDVGFGKTEVAMRAAFKAVMDGKQVAMLTPTTILARQQYMSFVKRFSGFPISIAHMSGFCTTKENKESAEGLKSGSIDIVIGTHRILSKDMGFKNLGLLIIDEEQRFGVTHKEKIKKLKHSVDVLALSATPIPRTLNMSLVGIRDMSVLEEPPVDRMPIQTFVTEQNDEIIKEAINREILRNGQVYYVINRVKGVESEVERLRELIPDVRIEYAHGQMDKKQLEKIMISFINGEIDVLVSTTIVETGMDISNVNTIIIENADRFGVSQLYQLRGRVGRSSRTAYAFLLFNREKVISEVAQKRLNAIRELTDLGSGYKLAMKDLEIRGAGSMLGKSQHGHISGVGFELYTQMINEAVTRLKGEEPIKYFETQVDIHADAYIPSAYIQKESRKMEMYKRISKIHDEEDAMDIIDELQDRFGDIPEAVVNLVKIATIKGLAHSANISEIHGGKKKGRWITRIQFINDVSKKEENTLEKIALQDKENIILTGQSEKTLLISVPVKNVKTHNEYFDYLKGLIIQIMQDGKGETDI